MYWLLYGHANQHFFGHPLAGLHLILRVKHTKISNSCSTACRLISSVYHPDKEKPLVGNITISALSWDGFNISWELKRGQFDGFLIEVADPDGLSQAQNHTVSGQEYSLTITDLSPSTFYRVALYGLYMGDLLEPVFGEAFTGTTVRRFPVHRFSLEWILKFL